MPRIPSYPLIGAISNDDLMIIDDVSQQYATKSVELQSLKGYFNTGQATTTYVDDKVVSGAAFNNGVLTLTRTDGVDVTQSLDGRYALTSSVFSGNYNDLTNKPTIPTDNSQLVNGAGYTDNLGVVQSLTTNNSSGAATLVGGVLNIPQYSGGGSGGVTSIIAGTGIGIDQSTGDVTITNTGPYASVTRTFTGSELVDAFNGSLSDKIVLVSVPAGKIAFVENALFIIKAGSTGTTNYNANSTLYVLPEGAVSIWGPRLPTSALNAAGSDYVFYSADVGSGSSLTTYGGVGADIILGVPSSGGGAVNISQGDRDVIVSVVYRIVDF